MKTIEFRFGCLSAEVCGALDHHVCGSTTACPAVKKSGVVCTFGTLTRTTFHDQADLAAEVAELSKKHKRAFGPVTAEVTASIQTKVLEGKNILTDESENDAQRHAESIYQSNLSTHTANPSVFGHG